MIRAHTVQKNCAACGDLITVRAADHKRGWGRFCDKSCAAAYKVGKRPDKKSGTYLKAPSIESQIGSVKVVKKLHSPCRCWRCDEPNGLNGPGFCLMCEADDTHPFSEDAVQGA